jgi:hypothetical protein
VGAGGSAPGPPTAPTQALGGLGECPHPGTHPGVSTVVSGADEE